MALLYELEFLPKGQVEPFAGTDGNFYRLADGRSIPVLSNPIWCRQCSEVTHGEELEPVEEIEKKIINLERLAAEIRAEIDPSADGEQQERIAELKLRRNWLWARRSPPRCLRCGSTNFLRLEHEKPVEIGRGIVTLTVVGFCDPKFRYGNFTPEGERTWS